MSILDEMENDAVDPDKIPDESGLQALSTLIAKQLELEEAITKWEYELSILKARLYKISETDIPAKFTELGIRNFTLEDGSKVEVKPYYAASINDENHDRCFEWLRKHNLDDTIKHEIKVVFGKGEDDSCRQLTVELEKLNVNFTDKEYVHPQTLKALVKEQIELMAERLDEEQKFPLELFNVFIGNKTKITKRRK